MRIRTGSHTCNNSPSATHCVHGIVCLLLLKLISTHEVKSLFFQTRDASCPMMRESKIRLWMRLWSPAAQKQSGPHCDACAPVRGSGTRLHVHSHSSDSGEISSMSERKLCRNWVLLSERCRRLQYSLGRRRAKLKAGRQRETNG